MHTSTTSPARPTKPAKPFDWAKPCAYDETRKREFHRNAQNRLRSLATTIGWHKSTHDLRSNKAGIAVCGEITLHHDTVYIQVTRTSMGPNAGILLRTCKGRRDYTGGINSFAPLSLLDDLPALARRVSAVTAP